PDRGRPIPTRMFKDESANRFLQKPLADGEVRYSGEPVAGLIAQSRLLAADAAELLDIAFEPPAVAPDVAAAEGAGSPVVARGEVEAAFAQADEVTGEELRPQRHAATPLETRGLLAEYDADAESLTVWGAAKIPHVNRRILAQLLGWDQSRIRLVELHVGGG